MVLSVTSWRTSNGEGEFVVGEGGGGGVDSESVDMWQGLKRYFVRTIVKEWKYKYDIYLLFSLF